MEALMGKSSINGPCSMAMLKCSWCFSGTTKSGSFFRTAASALQVQFRMKSPWMRRPRTRRAAREPRERCFQGHDNYTYTVIYIYICMHICMILNLYDTIFLYMHIDNRHLNTHTYTYIYIHYDMI